MTPIQLHVVAYFSNFLQKQNAKKPKSSNQRVKPNNYGEALTRDEILERIEDEERAKREKKGKKGSRKRKTRATDEEISSSAGEWGTQYLLQKKNTPLHFSGTVGVATGNGK